LEQEKMRLENLGIKIGGKLDHHRGDPGNRKPDSCNIKKSKNPGNRSRGYQQWQDLRIGLNKESDLDMSRAGLSRIKSNRNYKTKNSDILTHSR